MNPRRQSNFSTARMSPSVPSWIRSRNGQALVAVVLGDRHDEAEVRLDHPLLGRHVAALDLLGELDFLGRRQQRVPTGLAQEELQRIGRGLVDLRLRWRLRGLFVVDEVDSALLELPLERFGLERRQLMRLDQVRELADAHRAMLLGRFDQLSYVLRCEDVIDLDSHGRRSVIPGLPAEQTPYPQRPRQSSSQPKSRRTITRVMSSWQKKLELELVPDRKPVVPYLGDLRLQPPAGRDRVAMQGDEIPAATLVEAHGVEVVIGRYEPRTGAAGLSGLVRCGSEQSGAYPLPPRQSLQGDDLELVVFDAHERITDRRSCALGEEAAQLRRVLGQAPAAQNAQVPGLR